MNYQSTIDPNLRLAAEFYVPSTPKPLCLFFHGWHMTAAQSQSSGMLGPLAEEYFLVNVEMRGRGKSGGKPDASGHELLDGLDALDYARATWPDLVRSGAGPYVVGGSGGGGNTLALAGRAPDLFAAAAVWAAMSDYALWYQDDERGHYRDEMETKGWIGGTPQSNPDGYFARGGMAVLENTLAPILVMHGKKDTAVPVHHAERYEARARSLQKSNVVVHYNNAGHSSVEWPRLMDFLRATLLPPRLPGEGRLRLCGFLACRAFWLIADDPACVADLDYRLDDQGGLRELTFTQTEGRRPASGVLLRVFNPAAVVQVRVNNSVLTAPALAGRTECYGDFRWNVSGNWTAALELPR